ncbi:TetR/AcrR family transcriptional regulator [Paenibacillus sp. MMS20-IR301]|uniref:TetR/AcrR family transcriptional regulator n=1 Tax=Paenibacillus sp. MMS20-IR301 TaxID=2895946 RepID=UPI0028F136E5|nr:TetR/AcrR family transcriptional regulator [Paenibacillus sp. MMS20-IR301]WNS44175.1 TetR/AcrR family transcriptional regulator [Paenibacillus sp. MMS20-IR301]
MIPGINLNAKHKEARSRKAILEATMMILENQSYSSLTIEAVASQAGVGKSTIYRWWEHKARLVLDTFVMAVESEFVFERNLSVQENFKRQLEALARILGSKVGKSTLTIVTENDGIAQEFYSLFLSLKRKEAKQALQAAMEQGEVKRSVNMDVVLDLLYGPVYFQILIYKKMPDEHYIEDLLQHVMQGISAGV